MAPHQYTERAPRLSTDNARAMRADARRNRARVLEVAQAVFAAEGLSVPIDEIARRAGVGAGTIYRHFPTKEALFEAIVLSRCQRLIDEGGSLASAEDAGEAFLGFFSRMLEEAVTNRALFETVAGTGLKDRLADCGRELLETLGVLLVRAQRSGAVRADVSAADVKALLVGSMVMEQEVRAAGGDAPGRMAAIVTDGLRPR